MNEFRNYIIVFIIIITGVLLLSFFIKPSLPKRHSPYHLKLNELVENKWYYEVYRNSKLIIQQKTIPGVSGKQYFRSREEAEKIGFLVISKLRSGDIPVVSLNELKTQHVIFKE